MAEQSILEGTKKRILRTISVQAIRADETRSVSLENISFPTSFDLGPDRMIVPGELLLILLISKTRSLHLENRFTARLDSPRTSYHFPT